MNLIDNDEFRIEEFESPPPPPKRPRTINSRTRRSRVISRRSHRRLPLPFASSNINGTLLEGDDDELEIQVEEVDSPSKILTPKIINSCTQSQETNIPKFSQLSSADDFEYLVEEVVSPKKANAKPKEINHRTILRQIQKYLPSVELDAQISYVWTHDFSWTALAKDSDGVFFILEYWNWKYKTQNQKENPLLPIVGQIYRFTGLVILDKITPNMFGSLFLTFAQCGHSLDTYYRLLLTDDSTFTINDSPIIHNTNMEESNLAEELQKLRFSSTRNVLVPSLNFDDI